MATNAFNNELHKLSPTTIVTFIEVHVVDGPVLRFHPGENNQQQAIVWRGDTYECFGVTLDDLETSGTGPPPAPRMRCGNPGGWLSQMCLQYDSFTLATVVRKRTFARFLDAVNFPQGNPEADPAFELPRAVFKVNFKSAENREVMEFTLMSPFDAEGITLPRRRVLANLCPWRYREDGCGYTGTLYFDSNDVACVEGLDFCAKRRESCMKRHPGQPLPFGGFPASDRLAR